MKPYPESIPLPAWLKENIPEDDKCLKFEWDEAKNLENIRKHEDD